MIGEYPSISTPELIRENRDKREAFSRHMLSVNPGYTMNNEVWPGLAKVVEESGEVAQVCGKIMATFGRDKYYGGEDLREQLTDKIGDLIASLTYLIEENGLDKAKIRQRVQKKLKKYYKWKESNQ